MGIPYLAEESQDGIELGSAIYTPNFISVGYVPQIVSIDENGMLNKSAAGLYAWSPANRFYYILIKSYPNLIDTAVLAHEIGHYFGLFHINVDEWEEETLADEQSNVMHPFAWGRALHPIQCEKAKRYMLGWRDYQELCRPYAHADVSLDSDEEVDFTCGYRPDFDADSSP